LARFIKAITSAFLLERAVALAGAFFVAARFFADLAFFAAQKLQRESLKTTQEGRPHGGSNQLAVPFRFLFWATKWTGHLRRLLAAGSSPTTGVVAGLFLKTAGF